MRDRRFVAAHRGGPLTKPQHRALIAWACACVEHVLPLRAVVDERVREALIVAEEWARGAVTVGDARRASLRAIACANAATDDVDEAIARAAGHAVATAHMADHAPGAALYALQAVNAVDVDSVAAEKRWQRAQISDDLLPAVEDALDRKERFFVNDKEHR